MKVNEIEQEREYIVGVPADKMEALRQWLANPNGAHRINNRLVFEAVGGNAIWVRSRPYTAYTKDDE